MLFVAPDRQVARRRLVRESQPRVAAAGTVRQLVGEDVRKHEPQPVRHTDGLFGADRTVLELGLDVGRRSSGSHGPGADDNRQRGGRRAEHPWSEGSCAIHNSPRHGKEGSKMGFSARGEYKPRSPAPTTGSITRPRRRPASLPRPTHGGAVAPDAHPSRRVVERQPGIHRAFRPRALRPCADRR